MFLSSPTLSFLIPGDAPRREVYIPPTPSEDEGSIFETINAGINFDRYDDIPCEVTGRDPPRNISSFEECGFFQTTTESIKKCNYTKPTPVQKYSIPIVMKGRDLMACAQTGSGKTVSDTQCVMDCILFFGCYFCLWLYLNNFANLCTCMYVYQQKV